MADNIIVLVFCNACATSTAWKIAKIKYNGLEKLTEARRKRETDREKAYVINLLKPCF